MMHIGILENEYKHNKHFSDYVDAYSKSNGITVDEALQHACVKEVYLYYTLV